jgi:LacI family transcriptional regulator
VTPRAGGKAGQPTGSSAITIADVAARAGVSTATVSRILSGRAKARADTRERVVAAARELGYRPSGVARSLRVRTTRTLGLVITDITNPFYPELVRAAEDAARERGYAVFLCNAAEDPEREAAYLELLAERRVDGVIVASSGVGERHGRWLAEAPLPVVLVNCSAAEVDLPTVLSDHRAGGRMAVEHLIGLGHRRIGHVTAPPQNAAAGEREAGARDAIAAAGLAPGDLEVAVGDGHVSGGARAAAELLTRVPDLTAIFAYNDLSAIGVVREVRSRGLRVPEDVSVVGFDDVDVAAFADPPLTTISQDTRRLGRWAVERLLARIDDGQDGDAAGATALVVIPVRLTVRASTGPARRS